MKKIIHQPLLFFDGVCNLCNSSVQFIIQRDKQEKFKFASIQSDAAKEILLQFSKNNSHLDSLFLIHNDRIYEKSSAILRIVKILGGLYKLGMVLWIIPKPVRDWMYDYIAKNRFIWYGKKESCMLPTAEFKSRFIN